METLQSYITSCQRFVHDASNRFWSQQEWIDYINAGRRKTAALTGCKRQIVSGVSVPNGTSSLTLSDIGTKIGAGKTATAVLDVYLYYSTNTRFALRYYPYSQFARIPVVIYSLPGVPAFWSQINGTIYIAPTPAQDYTADFDVSIDTTDLVNLTDSDSEIVSPFSDCVPFYACYLAKLKDQRRQQAEEYLIDFRRHQMEATSTSVVRKRVGL